MTRVVIIQIINNSFIYVVATKSQLLHDQLLQTIEVLEVVSVVVLVRVAHAGIH